MLTLLLAPLALAALLLQKDEVVFKNGERIIGKIVKVAGGKITIDSDSLGTVTVPLDKVSTFSSEAPLDIRLEDGTVVNKRAQLADDGNIKLPAEGTPQVETLPISKIAKINPPPVKWTGNATLGAAFTRGNSVQDQASLDFKAERRTDDDRITLKGFYYSTRTKDVTTGESNTTQFQFGGSGQYDYFLSKTIYAFVNVGWMKDRVADLDYRFSPTAGLGKQWYEQEDLNWKTEVGIGWVAEKFTNGSDSQRYVAARVSNHIDAVLLDGLKGFHDVDWYPSLEDKDDQLVFTQGGLRAALSGAMYAEGKIQLWYDNTPATGKDRIDTKYILGIGISF